MLSSMRISKKNQPFVYGLLGLLALGLVGVASGGVDGSRISSIGKVGEEPITSYFICTKFKKYCSKYFTSNWKANNKPRGFSLWFAGRSIRKRRIKCSIV